MEERIEKLEKMVAELVTENKGLKQDISSLKTKLNSIELKNQDYLTRIMNLEKKEKYAQIQQKLTNAPKLNVKHNHTDWITTLCLMNGRYVLTGSKDCSIKCLTIGDDDDDEPVLFTIEKAHQSEVQYILKISDSEVIFKEGSLTLAITEGSVYIADEFNISSELTMKSVAPVLEQIFNQNLK